MMEKRADNHALSAGQVSDFAARYYGLDVRAVARLPGELDQNFLLTDARNERFVLKAAHPGRSRELLDLENQALAHLQQRGFDLTPRVLPNLQGAYTADLAAGLPARILSFLPGRLMGELGYHSEELLHNLGVALARMDLELASFSHPAMKRDLIWDLRRAGAAIAENLEHFEDSEQRSRIAALREQFESRVAPQLGKLPGQVIHNDANDFNIMVSGERISGLLDFGDVLYAPRICEIAIAAAYAGLNKLEPLQAAANLVAGYHSISPLLETELALLFDLIRTRLAVSISMAAGRVGSGNAYHQVHTRPNWECLDRLDGLHPDLAHFVLRQVCLFEPDRNSTAVTKWLCALNNKELYPVLPASSLTCLDLSPGSRMLPNLEILDDSAAFSRRIFTHMNAHGAQVGIGRYNEPRLIYQDDMFAMPGDHGTERRSIHIGLDLFAPALTRLNAPMNGVVHSLHDNAGYQNYGPTILLQHDADGTIFYTLYGHLSRECLSRLQVGQPIQAGDFLAEIGPAPINGDWPPHLHFQIITHLLGNLTDFPGVALPSQRDVFTSLCPDPNLVLRLPTPVFETAPASGPDLNQGLKYSGPVRIVRAHQQYLYDHLGQPYLNCLDSAGQDPRADSDSLEANAAPLLAGLRAAAADSAFVAAVRWQAPLLELELAGADRPGWLTGLAIKYLRRRGVLLRASRRDKNSLHLHLPDGLSVGDAERLSAEFTAVLAAITPMAQ